MAPEPLVQIVVQQWDVLVDLSDLAVRALVLRDVPDLLEDLEHPRQREGIDPPLLGGDDRERLGVLDEVDALDVRGDGRSHPGKARSVEFGRDDSAGLIDRLQAAVDILGPQTHDTRVHIAPEYVGDGGR